MDLLSVFSCDLLFLLLEGISSLLDQLNHLGWRESLAYIICRVYKHL